MIVLVLNYNDYETTETFIKSLNDYITVEHIVIVDNKSTDNSFERLKALEDKKIDVISSEKNLGYGGGNNLGINYIYKKYSPKRILLCNPDVIIEERVIIELEDFLENHKDYGIAAPFMLDKNGAKQLNTASRVPEKWEYILSIGMLISRFNKSVYYKNIQKSTEKFITVGAVAGSLFMMDTKKMIEHGMYDENMFLYCEETVLANKFKSANIKIALLPNISFVHNHSVSINKSFSKATQKQKILLKSKLYVIKHYYHASFLESLFAKLLGYISIVEVYIWNLVKSNILNHLLKKF